VHRAGGLISHIAPTLVRKGTGEWLRGQTEHCLLAARGKPVFIHGSYTTVLRASRREHSRKPDEFYTLVEDTCPGSRLELFARQARGLAKLLETRRHCFPDIILRLESEASNLWPIGRRELTTVLISVQG